MSKPASQSPASSSHSSSYRSKEAIFEKAPLLGSGHSSDAGLVVLSSSIRMLHINSRARSLMALFGEAHELWPHLSPESMPAILIEFCGDVFTELQRQVGSHRWAEFEMRRICHMVTPSLLLRGFGMPSKDGREPRMVLTLQPCLSSSVMTILQNRPDVPITASTNRIPCTR